jgi:hypothetical protein
MSVQQQQQEERLPDLTGAPGINEDQEEFQEDSGDVMAWRSSPEDSYSDWTIEVTRIAVAAAAEEEEDDKQAEKIISSLAQKYHVHRFVLGVGPRKRLVALEKRQKEMRHTHESKKLTLQKASIFKEFLIAALIFLSRAPSPA